MLAQRNSMYLCVSICITFLCLQSAFGNDASQSEQGAAKRSAETANANEQAGLLKEVIVTAERREQNAQTVPIAMTVLSQQTLDDQNVLDIRDLQYLAPSMAATVGGVDRMGLNLSIRGQGESSGGPGVVAYLDEVPIPVNQRNEVEGAPGLLFDLANVQVLEGPQGTLFGRNAVGGALLLQTAKPKDEFGGSVQAGYGNYDDRKIDGHMNIPLINDVLLARIAFVGEQQDGFTHLLAEPGYPNGIDADNTRYWAVRGTVTFDPTQWFDNQTVASYFSYNTHGSPFLLTAFNPAGLAAAIFPTFGTLFNQQQSAGIRTAIPIDTRLADFGSNLALSNITKILLPHNLTFRNILGYDALKDALAEDDDGTDLPILNVPSTPNVHWTRQLTEEAQLLGRSLVFGRNVEWILGVFYLDVPRSKNFESLTEVVFGGEADGAQKFGSQSRAAYGQGTYELFPRTKLTGGVRYTSDESAFEGGPLVGCCQFSAPSKSSALTWTAALDYQLVSRTFLYLTARRGYRDGGNNGVAPGTLTPLPNYGPEFVNDEELGVKSDWLAGSIPVRANADVYTQDYKDVQVTSIYFPGGAAAPIGITSNAARARVWGAEFQGEAQVTQTLRVGAMGDYLDFRYVEFGAGVAQNYAAALAAGTTENRPRWKYGVNFDYEVPGSRQLSLQGNWVWQSRQVAPPETGFSAPEPGSVIPAYGLLNLSLRWSRIGDLPVNVSAYVTNALNKGYPINNGFAFYNTLGFSIQKFGNPRMYGLRLRYEFGAEPM